MVTAQEMSKGRMILMLAAIFLSSMCTMGDMVVTPIAANLYEVFAGSPEWLINLGITGPALVGLPFCIAAGWLADHFDKKLLLVGGFAIFTVSAICGAMVENIYYFVVLRLLATGVGWGITNSAALAILADLFTNEDEHAKYVGWYNMVMSAMGAILSFVAGILAVTAWQNAFQIYWIAAPVLVMLVIFLPKFPTKAQQSKEQQGKDTAKAVVPAKPGWWKAIVPLTIQVFFVALCYFVLLYMISMYVADSGVGDEAFTGTLATIMTVATAISSAIFGAVYKKMKNMVYFPFVALIAVGFVVMGLMPSQIVAVVCCAVMGFSWPFYFCYFYVRVTELVPEERAGTATGTVAISDGLAAAGCSYFLVGLMDGLGMTSVQVWPIIGVLLAVVLAVSFVWTLAARKKNPKAAEPEAADAPAPTA